MGMDEGFNFLRLLIFKELLSKLDILWLVLIRCVANGVFFKDIIKLIIPVVLPNIHII